MANNRIDYDALMSRRESTVTVEIDGVMTTMTMSEYRKRFQPNKGKRSKKTAAGNSVTAVEAEIIKIEKACKYLNSLVAYNRNGYQQWGAIHTTICGLEPIRKPLGQICGRYNGYCKDYMARIKAMSRKDDKDLFQFINYLVNNFEIVKTNLDTLMHNISESGVLSAYRNEKAITENGRRLGLRILVQRSTRAMGDIEGSLNKLRELVVNGVDVHEYNEKGRRVA